MGKKAALGKDQQAQYDAVMSHLLEKGALKEASAEAGPCAKRPKVDVKSRPTPDTKPDPKPAAKVPKGKAKGKAKPGPTSEPKKPKPTKPEGKPKDDDSGNESVGPEGFFDEELKIQICWKDFKKVVTAIRKVHPKETEASIYEALTEALGPCPPSLQPAGLFAVAAVPPAPAASIKEDTTLNEKEQEDEADDAEDDECKSEASCESHDEKEEKEEEMSEPPAITRTSIVDPSQLETQVPEEALSAKWFSFMVPEEVLCAK